MNKTMILGSSSPRRSYMLTQLGIEHQIRPPRNEEILHQDMDPLNLVSLLAKEKMDWLEKNDSTIKDRWVLTADTLVFSGLKKYGKPKDRNHAVQILENLSGKEHSVATTIQIRNPMGETQSHCEVSQVFFKSLDRDLIDFYLNHETWQDAAGAYKIQELGDLLVKKIIGSFTNVMGLPLGPFYEIVSAMGFYRL